MKTTRRGFFGVLAAAIGVVLVKPEKLVEITHDSVSRRTIVDGKRIADVDIIVSDFGPRHLQEGINKIFSKEYEKHQVEWEVVFMDRPKG